MKITLIILNCITIGCLILAACPPTPSETNTTTETTSFTSTILTTDVATESIPTSSDHNTTEILSSGSTIAFTIGSDSFVTTFEVTESTSLSTTESTNTTSTNISSSSSSSDTENLKGSKVFVTSSIFNGNFSNVSPDEQCQNSAEKGKLDGNYRAWISFTNETAFDRVSMIPDTLIRLDGQIFSMSINDLFIGNINNPLNIDENLNVHNTEVWTASNSDGSLTLLTNCSDWSINNSLGYYGRSDLISEEWTMFGTTAVCNSQKALYCFEVEKQAN